MNGISCVKGEIHNVLAVLRITGRFNSSRGGFLDFGVGSSGAEQSEKVELLRHKLIASLKELHLFLGLQSEGTALWQIDTTIVLRPFCDVLLCDGIGGIDVMNVTLTSLHKLLLYGLITSKSLKCGEAMNQVLLEALFAMKFDDEWSSRSDSELIHIRTQEILLELLRSSAGTLLTDDRVCLCVQKCFEMRSYHGAYHGTNDCLMVRYTENVVIQMVLLIFTKMKALSPSHSVDADHDALSVSERGNGAEAGFGIKAMARIFKYLTVIINPNQVDSDQHLREFGLRLIIVALETAGHHLNDHRELIAILQDDLCRQLLINSQSAHFLILSLTLRVIFDLFNAVKQHIRVQLEVFFISIHLRIAESENTSFEHKELVLESIVEFCREPDLIVGLYTNYDCQVGSTHLFEDLCHFLLHKATVGRAASTQSAGTTGGGSTAITAHPSPGRSRSPSPSPSPVLFQSASSNINNLHLIAAEGILAIIDCISRKFIDSESDRKRKDHEQRSIEYEHIQREQKRKRALKVAARTFNESLGKSFPFLQSMGALKTPLDAQDIATFLHSNPYLNKIRIGEYLGIKKDLNTQVLDAYVSLFDFHGLSPDEALRHFLESFVLRGEAQQIERIIENFSQKLFDDRDPTKSPLKSKDAAFLMAYSMIQLNTDAHNEQIKNKMTLQSYCKNLRGVNDGGDFPPKFMAKIYHSITSNEIKVRSGNFKHIFNEKTHHIPPPPMTFDDDDDGDHRAQSQDGSNGGGGTEGGTAGDGDNDSVSSSGSRGSFFLDSFPSTFSVKDVKKSEWMHILEKTKKLHKFSTIAPPTIGAEMFNILWEPALSILAFHLRFAGHPKVLDRVVQGIQTLAKIAHHYQIRSACNAIIHSMCNHLIRCLLQFGIQNQSLPHSFVSRVYTNDTRGGPYSATGADGKGYASISVPYFLSATPKASEFASWHEDGRDEEWGSHGLAMDIRISFTVKAFFDLVKSYGGLLTDGWSSVMKVILWLFHLDLIPRDLFEMEDFTDDEGHPLPSLSDPVELEQDEKEQSGGNVLSSLFWWLSGSDAVGHDPAPNPLEQSGQSGPRRAAAEEVEPQNQSRAQPVLDPKSANIVQSVSECDILALFTASHSLHTQSFIHFVRALISLSNPECRDTVAAASKVADRARGADGDEKGTETEVRRALSATTHTITSLDAVPIESGQLMMEQEAEQRAWNERRRRSRRKGDDVICLPLTIDMKIFCLERLNQVVCANVGRRHHVWKNVTEHFAALMASKVMGGGGGLLMVEHDEEQRRHSQYLLERVTVCIFSLCAELTTVDDVKTLLMIFDKVEDDTLSVIGRRLIAGFKMLLNAQDHGAVNGKGIRDEKWWKLILSVIRRFASSPLCSDQASCLEAFHLMELIANHHLYRSNFFAVESVLCLFGSHEPSAPVHNTRVIELILSIHGRLSEVSEGNQTVLGPMWLKTLSNISSFATHSDYQTRRFAVHSLHKALLQSPTSFEVDIEANKLLFRSVLWPLLLRSKPHSKEDHQLTLKLLGLMFTKWLHDVGGHCVDDSYHLFWFKLLESVCKFIAMIRADRRCVDAEGLVVQCTESLKNVILVLHSQQRFEAMSGAAGHDTMEHTVSMLESVAPSLALQVRESTVGDTEVAVTGPGGAGMEQRDEEEVRNGNALIVNDGNGP